MKRRRIRWWDWLVYKLFHWRWNPILAARPDLREIIIANLKAFDVLDDGEEVTVTIEKKIVLPEPTAKSVEWEGFESFNVDGQLPESLTPEQCFTLGVEWEQIAKLADGDEGFEKPVHTENVVRLAKVLQKRGRTYKFFAYCEYDEWRWLKVLPRWSGQDEVAG